MENTLKNITKNKELMLKIASKKLEKNLSKMDLIATFKAISTLLKMDADELMKITKNKKLVDFFLGLTRREYISLCGKAIKPKLTTLFYGLKEEELIDLLAELKIDPIGTAYFLKKKTEHGLGYLSASVWWNFEHGRIEEKTYLDYFKFKSLI